MGKSGKDGDWKVSGAGEQPAVGSAYLSRRGLRGVVTQPATAYLLLVLGLLTTLLVSIGAWRQIRMRDGERFDARVKVIQDDLAQEFDRYSRVLHGARALWAIHPDVTRDEWREYVNHLALSNELPRLLGLGYIERVSSKHLTEFLEKVRRGGARESALLNFEVHPATTNEERYVVKFVEPLSKNWRALGYDIGSESNRCEAAKLAWERNEAALTHKIALVQASQSPGALLLLPIFAPGIQATNPALRRDNLRGWVYAAFVVEDILGDVVSATRRDVDVEVFDGPAVSSATQLYTSRKETNTDGQPSRVSFERTESMNFANCIWTLRFRPGPGFEGKPWLSAPGYIDAAVLGLCISLLVFGIVRTLGNTGRHAQRLANEMTAVLRLQHHAIACARNGIFILDATREDCPIIYANPAFEAMTAYSVKGTLGKDTLNLLRDRNFLAEKSTQVKGSAERVRDRLTVVKEYKRDGAQVWAEFRLVPVMGDQGRITHYLGIVEDITERKLAEKSLAKAEQRYQELVNNLNVGVYRNTPGTEGRFLEVNPAVVAMFEAGSREEILKQRVADLYVDPSRRQQLSESLLRDGSVRDAEIELQTLKGRKFWAAITATVKTDGSGVVVFDGVIVDITERKRALRALRESQERFALAVQGTNDGIWDWNVITSEVYFSPRWKGMLGYEENEVENTFAGWERLIHPEDREKAHKAIQAYFKGQTPTYELEHRLRHKDGTYRWILARGVVLRDADGQPVRMAGSHVDLTARKQAEERLRQAYLDLAVSQESLKDTLSQLQASHEELKRTQLQLIQAAKMESIGTLAAGVAHEVKNPLQTILIGLDYLDHSIPKPAENLEMAINDMRDAVWRANNIIKDLLQLSADSAFELAKGDLNAVVNRSLRLMNSEIVATRTNVVCTLEPGLPAVRMDTRKIEQVILNLLINAVQAMAQQGTLFVATRSGRLADELRLNGSIAGQFGPDERLVVAEIRDTGPGISPEHLSRIGDPFFTTKPVGKGTGLGLSIVKRIIALHDGAVEIQNATQGGVVVTLAFRASAE
jgi:PAS domain S-box-containing protein